MEALLPAFLAAFLAEWGDKTQLLVVALAAHYARAGPILAGVAVAALANALIAAAGGMMVHDMVQLRALTLLVAVALLFAGAAGMIRRSAPAWVERLRGGALVAAATGFFLAEFGDKTQFLTFAIAARTDSPLLAAAGATVGVAAASVPPVLLGPALARTVPVRAIRWGAAALFLATGLVVAVGALRLA